MRVAFYTLGCKLNQSESEALASTFKSRGFFIVRPQETADVYIINTCTVTSKAEQKARRIIRRLSRDNPDAVVIVTGCYAQLDSEELQQLIPNIIVLSHDRKHQLLDLAECIDSMGGCSTEASAGAVRAAVDECISGFKAEQLRREGIFRFAADTYSFHSRAFLKVQEGCDHKCAYCRVRLARGPSVSLAPEQVVERASHLYENGYAEIVLTGVNLTAYRAPENTRFTLPQLIQRLTDRNEEYRLRLSSLEPEMIRSELLQAVRHPRVCPHFHIPVQSGSDKILKAVHRPYTADRVRTAVVQLRNAKKDPFLAADVIVGLPGESDEDFQATYDLIKECEFAALHVFTFSPRPGTELYHAKQHVPERIAGERADTLRALADKLKVQYERRWIGKKVYVLVEELLYVEEREYVSGLSENYLRVHIPVDDFPKDKDPSAYRGSIVAVKIESAEVHVIGRLVKKE